ncbi:Protein root UVB sensitive [Seminavis robusta]|uniref:Protein root UVB sensitive n=1 Tax=Seminavis robusta TaxID=568900 RepID=A0A9N8E7Y1_9STRA|nr:Protein root UVB sensitive [Seminavis robusta]|eukprot:Sro642_g180200.1 Protein root UVB sensitive (541) ;mRNA; r:35485-37107
MSSPTQLVLRLARLPTIRRHSVLLTLQDHGLLKATGWTRRQFSSKSRQFQVTQFQAADGLVTNHGNNPEEEDKDKNQRRPRKVTVYLSNENSSQWTTTIPSNEQHDKDRNNTTKTKTTTSNSLQQYLFDNVITHFLPAHYPHSVAPGYAKFSILAFSASAAGSAAMVLSTQTLLLAVGVVGASSHNNASIMAGALNWVLKDGIGQLGGVIFASRMGHTKKFDSDPKRLRMLAALCLDGASLLEILSPFVLSTWVLPLACVANIGKNIGFLTASASRAAIHQSLARQGNLADVTAKSGTQSMGAGLVGTALGIGLSTVVLHHDATNFVVGFCVLSAIHQGCNYLSLKAVPLRRFNRHRLHWVLSEYCSNSSNNSNNNTKDQAQFTRAVLTPSQVAGREQYFPLSFSSPDDAHSWLSIGSSLEALCPGPVQDFQQLYELLQDEAYLLNITTGRIHLVFQEHATGEDLIKGMLHAYLLHHEGQLGETHADHHHLSAIKHSYQTVQETFPELKEELERHGWMTGTDVTSVEPADAYRLNIEAKA